MTRRAAVPVLGALLLVAAFLTVGPRRAALEHEWHVLLVETFTAVGLEPIQPTPPQSEALANVLLFVPLGALVAHLRPRWPGWQVVLALAVLSLAIEALQAIALAGRNPSPVDVVTNALGAALGVVAVRRLAGRRRGARHR